MLQHMRVRFRSTKAVYGFLLRRYWFYVIGMLCVIATVVGLVMGWPGTLLLIILGIFSAVVTVGDFYRNLKSVLTSFGDIYPITSQQGSEVGLSIKTSNLYNAAGYTLLQCNGKHLLYCENVNDLLGKQMTNIEIDPYKKPLNDIGYKIAAYVLLSKLQTKKGIWNDSKVRLVTDLTPELLQSTNRVKLQKTDFFTNLCTNEQTFTEYRSRSNARVEYDGTAFVARNGRLLDLIDSLAGNEIGISTIAISDDRKLIVLEQARANIYSADALAPSGSGGADWRDLTPVPSTLQEFVIRASEREFCEECGLEKPDVLRAAGKLHSRVIGFARFIERGGKPEFFCVTLYNGTSTDIQRKGIETVFVANHSKSFVGDTAYGIDATSIRNWFQENKIRLSLSLYANLVFLETFVRANPDWYDKLKA